jgi:hypothetical protein
MVLIRGGIYKKILNQNDLELLIWLKLETTKKLPQW